MPFINGFGPVEVIILLIIALIVVGPGKLPDVGAALGKSIREFRKAASDVQDVTKLDPAPAPAAAAPAPAVPAVPPAPVVAAPVAAATVAAGTAPEAAAPTPAVDAAPAAADTAASEWPAEATPVDEQQPTASA